MQLSAIVVDDEPPSRRALVATMRRLGHEVREATGGREALNLHEHRPADLILSGWRIPDLDGLALCEAVRARKGSYTHFILLTGLEGRDPVLHIMRTGADDCLSKPVDVEDLEARLVAVCRRTKVTRELAERNEALARDGQALSIAARTDPLTNAFNRRRLEEDLQGIVDRARRYGHRYCAALCDIDHFKQYNDQYGHLAGDDALRIVAQTMRNALRVGDGFYRYGGEEFLALLPEQSLSSAGTCMDRLRSLVAAIPTRAEGGVLARQMTISVGLAEIDVASSDRLSSWMERADRALYCAKGAGRNRVQTAA